MQTILNALTSLPTSDYTALLAFIGAGGGVSVVLQFIKHFKGLNSDLQKHGAAISRVLVTVLSFIVSAANYIISSPKSSISTLLAHTGIILAAAHLVYWVSVSPIYKWFITLLKDAENYKTISAPQAASVAEQPPEEFNQ